MLPNFFIVGAPKAGTTSLYHYLNEHPDIFMADPKELNYFSGSEIRSQELYYKAYIVEDLPKYKDHFSGSEKKIAVGEASVSYLFYKEVPGKIFELVPDAKIVIILRDPVERAFSHYLMDERLGYISIPFEDVVYRKKGHTGLELFYQQYLELGFYHDQVKRYLDTFGKNRVRIYFFNDLLNSPRSILEDLFKFLDVKENLNIDIRKKHNVRIEPNSRITGEIYKSGKLRKLANFLAPGYVKKMIKNVLFSSGGYKSLDNQVEKYLRKLYDSDIKKLGGLLSRDIPFWR